MRRLWDWLTYHLNGEARLAQQRATAYAAFQRAKTARDTRAQAQTWPALASATHQLLAAEIGRAPARWRGK